MEQAELDIIDRLQTELAARELYTRVETAYYEGQQRLTSMGLAIPPEMRNLSVIVNWPGMYVDSLEHRQDVEGFRLAGGWRGDEQLWDWWQYNDLDEESSLAHLEALIHGRAYVCVGYNEEDPEVPLITVESPQSMIVMTDSRTRRVTAALRLYEPDPTRDVQGCVLYLPDVTIYAEQVDGRWVETDRHDHRLGIVPVVALINRARVSDRQGRTEMRRIMGLTDAACRSLMNLQGAQELMATPQRYILGADEGLFQDELGNPMPTWQAYLAHILAIPESGTEVKVGQFTAADLRNFTDTLNAYAHHVSALTGLPSHYLGLATDNPASADAIRSSEARLVKSVERKNRAAGGGWEQAMRIGLRITGGDPDAYRRLETIWRDPATPTVAEKADAVQKLSGGQPLYDRETALEELGFSPERIRVVMQRVNDDPMLKLMAMEGGDQAGADDQPVQQQAGGDRAPAGASDPQAA
ncbi:phage portal protein [Saccharopolyspora aridisoli]|uniref:Phage portal protein n=1 Tax=Saccharopolyspora aridisoli TaxID=2530385 RepID=A0A4R4UUK3_9PSEU|nr:phage portal protein [Saccharopolyspora aridisoli]TDC92363.1 phage portal protein [Saccharopolyspora aridisoli]